MQKNFSSLGYRQGSSFSSFIDTVSWKNNIPLEIGYWPFCTNGVESMGNRKINTIGFGPGNEELAHTTDEYIEIQQIKEAYKVYEDLINILDRQ